MRGSHVYGTLADECHSRVQSGGRGGIHGACAEDPTVDMPNEVAEIARTYISEEVLR
jgi:hypothetical protein